MGGFDQYEMPEEVVDAGSEGWVRSSSNRTRIDSLKSGNSMVLYFVNDPGPEAKALGDWINYREVSAFQGFKGGLELPNGLKEFPVHDLEIVQGPDGPARKFRRNDDGSPADWLLDQVAEPTKFKTKSGRAEGRDKMVVNIVDEEGNHKLLKMTGTAAKLLRKQIKAFRSINKGFTLLSNPWKLSLTGTGSQQDLSLEPIEESYPDSLRPDQTIDAREVLKSIRDEVESFYQEALAGGTATFDDDGSDDYETVDPPADEDTDDGGLAEIDPWKNITANQIREALESKGLDVPKNATKSALTRLALSEGIKPSDVEQAEPVSA